MSAEAARPQVTPCRQDRRSASTCAEQAAGDVSVAKSSAETGGGNHNECRHLVLDPPCTWEWHCAQQLPEIEYVTTSVLPTGRGPAWSVPNALAFGSPYDEHDRLLALRCGQRPPVAVFECGLQPRVVRAGPRKCLEVYWCGPVEGWGVRALDPLELGEFVCEYAGEIVLDGEAERRCLEPEAPEGRDAYLFNLTTPGQCQQFGATPVGVHPIAEDDPIFVIDAFHCGNIGRFINHACGPSSLANITPVFVFAEDVADVAIDARLPRVCFFANRPVGRGEELRYDYDMRPDEVGNLDGSSRVLPCYCRSEVCRGRIY